MPKYEQLRVPPGTAARANLEAELGRIKGESNDTNVRVRVDKQLAALASNDIVSKYEKVQGRELCSLDLSARVKLMRSPEFARDLGKTAVLTSVMGLADHAGLGTLGAKANMRNLLIDDNGRLKLIDFDANRHNPPGLGFSDRTITSGLKDVVKFFERITGDKSNPSAELRAAVKAGDDSDLGGHPFAAILNATTTPFMRDQGTMFDTAEGNALTAGEKEAFAKNLMAGALEGLAYLRDNADAFAAAHQATGDSAVRHPDKTFGEVAKLLAGVDKLQGSFAARFG